MALDRPWAPVAPSVDHLVGQLDALGLDRPVLVGHSAGAELAALAACRRPVAGLVLVAPVIGSGPPAPARWLAGLPGVRAVGPPLLRLGIRRALRGALRRAWADPTGCTPDVVDGYRRPLLEPGAAEALWAMTARAAPLDVDWSALAAVPTLVIVGDRDRWTTAVPLESATVRTYERCGHLPQEEQPTRFVEDVLAFLATSRP